MPSFTQILASATIFLVAERLLRRWWHASNQREIEDAFGRAQGCLPMNAVTRGKWPLNVDLVKGLWDANNEQRLLAFQQGFIDKLGPNLEQRLLGDSGLVTLDPENVKAILSRSRFREGELDYVYGKRRDAFFPLLGEGLFTQDGPPWKHSRELLRRQFARIQYHNLDNFSEHVETLISRLANSKTATVDLQPLFFNFTLDTTTSLLFGESANSLHEDSSDDFGENFDEASWISAIRVKLVDYYWVYTPKRYLRACNNVKTYADTYVKKALDERSTVANESDRYLFVRSLYKDLEDRSLVRDQLINVLLAGRDTTACCLAWTFRLLVRHPNVLRRLKNEIFTTLGGHTEISKAEIQQLPYLRTVLTETLRLYPSVAINVRTAAHPTVLPRGGGSGGLSPVLVRKGQGVGFSPYHMHRRKDLYGNDACEFRPERWEDGKLQERIGWGYLPFNGGPRICLGQEFALLEASYAIIRILQSFPNLSLPHDEKIEPIGEERQVLTFTVSSGDGCRVQLRA